MQLYIFLFLNLAFSYAGDDYYSRCVDPKNGSVSFLSRTECLPDTLYSWQPYHSINWGSFNDHPPITDYLYTWRSPIGTIGYGDTQIRMKVAPGVIFKVIDDESRDCAHLLRTNPEEKTIFVAFIKSRKGKTLTDFLICSMSAIESWSAHTEESYSEAIREADYIWEHYFDVPQSYDSYLTYISRLNYNRYIDKSREKYPFSGTLIADDGTDWSKKTILKRIQGLKIRKNPAQGKVFGRNTQNHFKTNVKLYY